MKRRAAMGKGTMVSNLMKFFKTAFKEGVEASTRSKNFLKSGFDDQAALKIADDLLDGAEVPLKKIGKMETFEAAMKDASQLNQSAIDLDTILQKETLDKLNTFNKDLSAFKDSQDFKSMKRLAQKVLQPDEAEKLIEAGMFDELRRRAKLRMYAGERRQAIEKMEERLNVWAGEDFVAKTKLEAAGDKDLYAGKLYRAQLEGHKYLEEAQAFQPRGTMGTIGDIMSDLGSTAGKVYADLHKGGRKVAAGIVENMYLLNEAQDMFKMKTTDLFKNASSVMKNKENANSIRRYIENMDVQNLRRGGTPYSKMVEGDWKLAAQLGLTVDDVKLSNKIVNAFRNSKRVQDRWAKNRIYDSSDLPVWNEVRDDVVQYKQLLGQDDFGANYFHAVGTKDYLQKIMQKSPKLADRLGLTLEDEHKKAFAFWKMRKDQSSLRMDDANRLAPWEELDHYHRQYTGYMVKRQYSTLNNELHRALLLDVQPGSVYKDIIQPLQRHINVRTAHKPYVPWSEKSPFGKAIDGFMQTNIALALQSPRMWFFNHFQGAVNGSSTKGFTNEFLSVVKMDAKLLKEFGKDPMALYRTLRDPNELNTMFRRIAKNQEDPFARSLFDRYVNEHPEFYKIVLPYEGGEGKLRKVTDIITNGFQASDKIARFAMFNSALNHGKKAHAKFVKNIKGGMNRREALAKLWKDAHLGEFDNIAQKKIVDAINFKNIENNKEFLYQYGKRTVKVEGFDYNRAGSPFLKEWAQTKSPLLATAMTFTTWNMYYTQLLKGAVRSFQAGDKRPLTYLGAFGFAWYVGAGMAASSDSEIVADYGRYATGRIPGLSPILGLWEMPFKEPAGVWTPVLRGSMLPVVAGLDYVNDKLFPGTKKNSIDYMLNDSLNDLKHRTIGYNRLRGYYEFGEQLVNDMRSLGLNTD
jgi:hypothetical protein